MNPHKIDRRLCPCASGQLLEQCCGPYLQGAAFAPDPVTLMRSRYTAYVLGAKTYLLETWHHTTRPTVEALEQEDVPVKWIALEVLGHEIMAEDKAQVAFIARYKINGRAHRMQETSRFLREAGRWYYLDGDVT